MKEQSRRVVCVVDDDQSVRASIARLLVSVGLPCKSFAAASEFLEWVESGFVSCLILDIRMPGPSGLDLQQMLAAAGREIPVIFVTAYADVPLTVRAMKAGALEVLTKPFDEQALLDAVQRALETARSWREEKEQHRELQARLETLTPRERQVMALVADGLMNKEIATALGIAEGTIKVHRAGVMRKMNADSFAALVRMADRLQLAAKA
jgi:RNA polymerase sigma factor (sigma-70 family)